ncbi:MAG: ATP synthase subunit I [Sphingomonadaceae bacterium]
MSNTTNISKPIYRVVALQFAIATGFALLAWNLGGELNAWSAAYGGAIAVIGSLMYAMIVAGGTNDAHKAFRSHIRAEVVKIFITVVLFVLALALFQSASWLWLILGFAVATLAYWFSLLAV